MPAKSKEQQRLFGMVHAYQKGELKNASKEVKDIADDISYKDAKDFAETKHKGLPNKVKSRTNKNMKKKAVKINENTLRQIVAESVEKVLKESKDEEEAMDIYKELCQTIGVKNIDDIEIKPKFQLGKAYLIFNDKFGESGLDLKRFAKYFIHENGLNNDHIFDIKGFSNDHTLWIQVFRKDF